MNELVIMVLLSIIFTFIAFIISKVMIKTFKISNAKNRFLVLFIVMLTAFSIFSFTIIGAPSNNQNQIIINENQNILTDEYSSIIVVVEETEENENSLSNEEFISINSENELIRNPKLTTLPPYFKISTFINDASINQNFLNELIENKIKNSNTNDQNLNNLQLSEIIHTNENINKNNENEYFSLFYYLNLTLIFSSILYLICVFLFGKKLILKKYDAKQSKNYKLNKLIFELADELKINKIKIYLYDGAPNAFVFGFPKSIAISTKMINLLSKKELESTIKHELSHIKNNDIILKPILQMIRILFFYNPFIHIIYYYIIRERELMADSVFIKSKVEKISLIEALIKINNYSNQKPIFSKRIIGTYSLPLFSYNSKKLAISDRFDHLFGNHTKKTIYTILISLIIIISNLTMIAVANSIIKENSDDEITDGYVIENIEISQNINNNHIKSIYRVFEDNNPQLYKKCVIYYVLVDIKSNLLSQRDLLNTVKYLLDE